MKIGNDIAKQGSLAIFVDDTQSMLAVVYQLSLLGCVPLRFSYQNYTEMRNKALGRRLINLAVNEIAASN